MTMKTVSLAKTLAFQSLMAIFLAIPSAFAVTPEEMVKKADEARVPEGAVTFLVTIKDFNGSSARESRFRVSSKGGGTDNNSLVESIYPDRLKGRKLLMNGNDLWFYLPTVKRPTRISFRERLTGEVANGDISRTNFAGDYDAKLVGKETISGKPCVKLALSAKHKDVTYSKIDYWLDAKTYIPVKSAFYAVSGKLLKTGEYSGPKKVMGAVRATVLVIKDALQPSRRSVLEFSAFKRAELPDSFFNKESLSE
ncbi:MAG: outer membrane lipoprotein-sorting protein [Oligoflexia bacterium]|nr:outer membrane lipoprotein-sorting protein [Oligoflexia bacterium]